MTYPTSADAIADDWVTCAAELEQAIAELGVTATVEARNDGTPGSDLLVVSFSSFSVYLAWDEGRWLFGSERLKESSDKLTWVDDLQGFTNFPARGLAVYVLARSLLFYYRFAMTVGKLPKKIQKDIPFDQALLFELVRAQVSATTPGHWLDIDENATEEEDEWLTNVANICREMVESMKESDNFL